MNSLAELKRTIKTGMKLRVVSHEYRPELTGTIRTVEKVQTNGYWWTCEGQPKRSWSGYASAAYYSFPAPNVYRHDEGLNPSNGKYMAWTIEILGKEEVEHSLIIHSLHDAQAECSCGGWTYCSVGATTREHVEEQFSYHLR